LGDVVDELEEEAGLEGGGEVVEVVERVGTELDELDNAEDVLVDVRECHHGGLGFFHHPLP
jgi:hypothetical protein